MADYNLYTHEEVKRAREEGYQDGRRASKWTTWDWESFYLTLFSIVLVLAIAGTVGYFKYENRNTPVLEWTSMQGQPCVMVQNPDYQSTNLYQDETWVMCLEERK